LIGRSEEGSILKFDDLKGSKGKVHVRTCHERKDGE
jgi:hypothetical protein